jgi:crossover junction endodeoxyribonuclease RusA
MSLDDAYVLVIPAPAPFINLNDRTHFHAKAALTKKWREATAWAALQARLPRIDQPVTIDAAVCKANRVKFDAHNLLPTVKAAIDGLVKHPKFGGADVLADDDNDHVTALTIRQGGHDGRARLILTIRLEGRP